MTKIPKQPTWLIGLPCAPSTHITHAHVHSGVSRRGRALGLLAAMAERARTLGLAHRLPAQSNGDFWPGPRSCEPAPRSLGTYRGGRLGPQQGTQAIPLLPLLEEPPQEREVPPAWRLLASFSGVAFGGWRPLRAACLWPGPGLCPIPAAAADTPPLCLPRGQAQSSICGNVTLTLPRKGSLRNLGVLTTLEQTAFPTAHARSWHVSE